jgi:hypothetical protein
MSKRLFMTALRVVVGLRSGGGEHAKVLWFKFNVKVNPVTIRPPPAGDQAEAKI